MSTSKAEIVKEPKKRVIAPGTPSPRKKRRVETSDDQIVPAVTFRRPELPPTHVPQASNLLRTLEKSTNSEDMGVDTLPIDFSASHGRPTRDAETLTIIEKLEMGPYEYVAPPNDPNFEQVEPHSDIRLDERKLSHEDLSDFLRGRYYLSPAKLYSIVRPSKHRQEYEVPIDGEWVTIVVVAERGEVKVSYRGASHADDDDGDNKNSSETTRKNGPKKYTTIRLVDLGGASADGKGRAARGDAHLNMILFEADVVNASREKSSRSVERTYKGGSGGAFERSSSFPEGTVIAICSPRVLKPYQGANTASDKPNPINNLLGITPTSASSILVLGKSRDLGHCAAVKKDGKPCGSWCDKRIATACEYHLQQAVQSRRAGRAEFAIGTSGAPAQFKRKANGVGKFDPSQKTGLLPSGAQAVPSSSRNLSGDTGAMYVVGSEVVRTSRAGREEFVSENIGRERQEKSKRKRAREEEEGRLSQLFTRDPKKIGTKVLASNGTLASEADDKEPPQALTRKAFSVEAVKRIGFDPTTMKQTANGKNLSDADTQRKLSLLEGLQKPQRKILLGKRPSVAVPTATSTVPESRENSIPPPPTTEGEESDSELEFED